MLLSGSFSGKTPRVFEILFPGYLFANFKNHASPINFVRSTRGAQSFVAFGGTPARIPPALIEEIREQTKLSENVLISDLPKAGDTLKVIDGLFNGTSVIFSKPNGEDRADVLMNMMNQ